VLAVEVAGRIGQGCKPIANGLEVSIECSMLVRQLGDRYPTLVDDGPECGNEDVVFVGVMDA
jgi:hypothetical protein